MGKASLKDAHPPLLSVGYAVFGLIRKSSLIGRRDPTIRTTDYVFPHHPFYLLLGYGC